MLTLQWQISILLNPNKTKTVFCHLGKFDSKSDNTGTFYCCFIAQTYGEFTQSFFDWPKLSPSCEENIKQMAHLVSVNSRSRYIFLLHAVACCTFLLFSSQEIQDLLTVFTSEKFLCWHFSIFVCLVGLDPVLSSLWLVGWGKSGWPLTLYFVFPTFGNALLCQKLLGEAFKEQRVVTSLPAGCSIWEKIVKPGVWMCEWWAWWLTCAPYNVLASSDQQNTS